MTDTEAGASVAEEAAAGPNFGTMSVSEAAGEVAVARDKFRIAILGDFTGRASRGALETGDALAGRRPIKFDVDTVEDVIEGFATSLVLPIGPEGTDVEVPLRSIDDLHPDELYDNVEAFAELATLRRQLTGGRAEQAMATLQGWSDEFGDLKRAARGRAKGADVPADRKLTDFQSLIGGAPDITRQASPADELVARIVGPHVRKAKDPAVDGMIAAVDEALSGAMRALLHHPDYQAVESTWRSLDLMARRIETGGGLEMVLYDVAAEEFAADLSAVDEMSETGLFRMLYEKPGLDAHQGPFSATIALYQFEETPPHAELLGRMARIAAYMDAPFVTSVSAKFLDTKTDDLHPLVKDAWGLLRQLPEAVYVGLAGPRFLLRHPYGKKTDPIDPFDFEEFTAREGLKGMLWANPAVLVGTLLGAAWRQGGGKVDLGKVMSLDDIPFHYYVDQHGDQVALPCTERLITEKGAALAATRSFMPVLSIQGRNEIRLGSFRSLSGDQLAGPWATNACAGPAAIKAREEAKLAAEKAEAEAAEKAAAEAAAAAQKTAAAASDDAGAAAEDDLDALLADLDEEAEIDTGEADDTSDLDALLAGLDEPAPDAEEPPSDDELDALLADLDAPGEDEGGEDDAGDAGDTDAALDDLDALLAGFSDDESAAPEEGEDDMDDELEALLRDL